jgi:hypothetical protein
MNSKKHFLLVIFIFLSSISFSQTKEHKWNVGLKNLWYNENRDSGTGYGLGIFVNHQMTIFNSPKWWLVNELGYERILSESKKNRPIFWYRDAGRYSVTIARDLTYKSNSLSLGLGLSFMYGYQLSGGITVNGEFTSLSYSDELSFGPAISLTYRNRDLSDRFGLRIEQEIYGRNRNVKGLSLLYRIY